MTELPAEQNGQTEQNGQSAEARVYKESELCPEYGTKEGCTGETPCPKGVHPIAPNGNVTSRICDYYMTERGCAKAERCDFLHYYGKPKAAVEPPSKPICAFYLMDRGCVKDDKCDFLHPKAPDGTVTKRLCEYYDSPRGCAKAERCDFLHLARRHLPAQCQGQGGFMDGFGGGFGGGGHQGFPGPLRGGPTKAQEKGNTRVCNFYNTARGCAKGDQCDFVHQGPEAGQSAGAAAAGAGAAGAGAAASPAAYGGYGAYDMYAAYGYGGYAAAGYGAGAAGYGAGAAGYGADAAGYGAAAAGYGAGAAGYGAGAAGYGAAAASPANPYVGGAGGAGVSGGAAAGSGPAPGEERVCRFYTGPRGCRKGDQCEFVHPVGAVSQSKPSHRYAPY